MEECVANVVCGMRFFRVEPGSIGMPGVVRSRCDGEDVPGREKWFALCANVPHLKIEIWDTWANDLG